MQIERLMDRQDMTRRAAAEMLEVQLPIEEKKKYADHIVYNDGSLESTRLQVRALWEELVAFQLQPRDGQRAFREDNS
jgi:dephospho-CoA kinase